MQHILYHFYISGTLNISDLLCANIHYYTYWYHLRFLCATSYQFTQIDILVHKSLYLDYNFGN